MELKLDCSRDINLQVRGGSGWFVGVEPCWTTTVHHHCWHTGRFMPLWWQCNGYRGVHSARNLTFASPVVQGESLILELQNQLNECVSFAKHLKGSFYRYIFATSGWLRIEGHRTRCVIRSLVIYRGTQNQQICHSKAIWNYNGRCS